MAAAKIGAYVQTNILHIDSAAQEQEQRVLRKIAHDTIDDIFIEEDPSITEWFRDLAPTASDISDYFHNLFPSASWTRRYNLHWLLGDAVAGKEIQFLLQLRVMSVKQYRHYRGLGSGSSSHGLCFARSVKPGLRPIYGLHRLLSVLDIWDLKRHCHWRKRNLVYHVRC